MTHAPAAPVPRRARAAGALRRLAPGLALASAGCLAGLLVHLLLPGVPAVLVALVLGLLVANGFRFVLSGELWMSLAPGLVLALLVMSINLVADRLRDVINPRLAW